MSPTLSPVILPCLSAAEFLEYILQYHAAPTTAVVCFQHESFLAELHCAVNQHVEGEYEQYHEHQLMNPTIHQLAISRTVKLVFAPTLPHLRAYLAIFSSRTQPYTHLVLQDAGQRAPMLAIYGLLELHHSTSELSAQGLSRTFATAVEAARMASMKLVIVESSHVNPNGELLASSEVNEIVAIDPWKVQIALLNGSVRLGGEDRVWAGRTIEAARVAARWCNFLQPGDVREDESIRDKYDDKEKQ